MRSGVWGRSVRLRYLVQIGAWPSGNPRLYLRRKGQRWVPMPDLPADEPAFLAFYAAALGSSVTPSPPRTGSIHAGVEAFQRSDAYLAVAPSTRAVWRRHLARIATD